MSCNWSRLKNDDPFGDVSAATGPAARRSPIEPQRIANLNRRIWHLPPWRRAGQRGIALHPVVNGDPMPRTSRWRLGVGRFGSGRGSRRGRNSPVRDGETDLSAVLLRQGEPDFDHLLEGLRVRERAGILGAEPELGGQPHRDRLDLDVIARDEHSRWARSLAGGREVLEAYGVERLHDAGSRKKLKQVVARTLRRVTAEPVHRVDDHHTVE